jgi:hypothetical protein
MIAYRTIYVPVEKKCEVKFILYIQPIYDPHFYEPAHYLKDEAGHLITFDTREEAEKEKAICEQGWCTVTIEEQVFYSD